MTTAAQVERIRTSSSASRAFGLRRPAVRAGASPPEPIHDTTSGTPRLRCQPASSARAVSLRCRANLVGAGSGPTLWRAGSADGQCATDRAPAGKAKDGRHRGVQRSRLPRGRSYSSHGRRRTAERRLPPPHQLLGGRAGPRSPPRARHRPPAKSPGSYSNLHRPYRGCVTAALTVDMLRAAGPRQPICSARATMMPAGPRRLQSR